MNLEARTFLWFPADGSPPLNLTDRAGGYRLLAGATGLDMVTYTYSERRSPGQVGVTTTAVRPEARDMVLPFIIQAADPVELRQRTQALIRSMRPTRGPGRLQVIQPSGESRWLTAKYMEGLEGSEARDAKLPGRWYRSALKLRADAPYARTQPITVSWSLAPTGRGWFPTIPIQLTPSGIAGRKTVLNPGDVDTHSIITVRGPGEQLIVRHRGTGRAAHLNYRIPDSGDAVTPRPEGVVIIDTAAKTIVNGYGANLFRYLTDEDPSLFPLLPGTNPIEVQLQSASRNSSVSMTFAPLFESL